MRIERWDVHRDGPLAEGALQHKIERDHRAATLHIYPPASVVAMPADTAERLVALASGLLKITIGDESAILAAGDIVVVPSGRSSRLEALGPATSRCFHCSIAG